jgi:hypothetical protein
MRNPEGQLEGETGTTIALDWFADIRVRTRASVSQLLLSPGLGGNTLVHPLRAFIHTCSGTYVLPVLWGARENLRPHREKNDSERHCNGESSPTRKKTNYLQLTTRDLLGIHLIHQEKKNNKLHIRHGIYSGESRPSREKTRN